MTVIYIHINSEKTIGPARSGSPAVKHYPVRIIGISVIITNTQNRVSTATLISTAEFIHIINGTFILIIPEIEKVIPSRPGRQKETKPDCFPLIENTFDIGNSLSLSDALGGNCPFADTGNRIIGRG